MVNSVDRSLTIVPLETPSSAVTVGLAPDGSPVSVAVGRGRAGVPEGTLPAAVGHFRPAPEEYMRPVRILLSALPAGVAACARPGLSSPNTSSPNDSEATLAVNTARYDAWRRDYGLTQSK